MKTNYIKPEIMPPKLHAGYMEVAIAELIGWRQNIIVPNVYWGLDLRHEADLLVLDKDGRLTEVEIKISKSDLKADFRKKNGHHSKIIGRLVYAVPYELVEEAKEIIPVSSGLISVNWDPDKGKFKAKWVRLCKHSRQAIMPDQNTVHKLMHLGCMRIWSLKSVLNYGFKIRNKKHPLPADRFDAEEWLGEHKDIWNHPIITSRENRPYEVADLMAEFANWYYKKCIKQN